MADRNVLILFREGMTIADQSAIALRIHAMWRETDVEVDDHMYAMVLSGDCREFDLDRWLQSLNTCPDLVALETAGEFPDSFAYEFELEYAMMDAAGRLSIRFANKEDLDLFAEFSSVSLDGLTCTIRVDEGGPDENDEYEVLSVNTALATACVNLKEKLLVVTPTWEGHKRYLDSDRLTEYKEEEEEGEE